MGWKLVAEVADHAPDGLTWREYAALLILAQAAWDTGKRARQIPGIEGNKKLIGRLRLPGRSTRFEVLQALVEKGALVRAERGRHGTGAAYAIPPCDETKGPGTPDPSDDEGSRFSGRRVRVSGSKGPGTPDPQQTTTRQEAKQSSTHDAAVADIAQRAAVSAEDAEHILAVLHAEAALKHQKIGNEGRYAAVIPAEDLRARLGEVAAEADEQQSSGPKANSACPKCQAPVVLSKLGRMWDPDPLSPHQCGKPPDPQNDLWASGYQEPDDDELPF